MALFKSKVDFDPADATNHDRVGSFILGSGGLVATTTDLGGGVIALDVNVADVTLDSGAGVFSEDSAASDGHKGMSVLMVRQDALSSTTSADGDFQDFKGTDKGELYTHDADALTALNSIDTDTTAIASFVAGLDAVADDAVAAGNPLLMGAVAHTPASALSAVSASLDKVHFATDLHRRQYVNDSMGIAWQCASVAVGTSAVRLDATPLATRRKVTIQNVSAKSIWVGSSNAVTSGTGLWIPKYTERDLPFTAALQIWAIGEVAAQDIRFSEAG